MHIKTSNYICDLLQRTSWWMDCVWDQWRLLHIYVMSSHKSRSSGNMKKGWWPVVHFYLRNVIWFVRVSLTKWGHNGLGIRGMTPSPTLRTSTTLDTWQESWNLKWIQNHVQRRLQVGTGDKFYGIGYNSLHMYSGWEHAALNESEICSTCLKPIRMDLLHSTYTYV